MREEASPCGPAPSVPPAESAPLSSKAEQLSSFPGFRNRPRGLEPLQEGQNFDLLGQDTSPPTSREFSPNFRYNCRHN